MKLLFAATLAFTAPGAAPAQTPPVATIASAEVQRPIDAMLRAMRDRDVAALGKQLSSGIEPQIAYYWGETVSGREAILQWHREWFAETGWSLEPGAITHALVGRDLAIVTAPVRYIKSAERQFLILIQYSLIQEGGAWKVARIQQTLLDGPK